MTLFIWPRKTWESNCVFVAVPPDGIAPLDARAFAGIVMINSESHIYTESVDEV